MFPNYIHYIISQHINLLLYYSNLEEGHVPMALEVNLGQRQTQRHNSTEEGITEEKGLLNIPENGWYMIKTRSLYAIPKKNRIVIYLVQMSSWKSSTSHLWSRYISFNWNFELRLCIPIRNHQIWNLKHLCNLQILNTMRVSRPQIKEVVRIFHRILT